MMDLVHSWGWDPNLPTGSSPGAGTEMPAVAEQGGQGCRAASRPAVVGREVPPSQLQTGVPYGVHIPIPQAGGCRGGGGGGGRRAGGSAAHVSQYEPKSGSVQGFDAGDV